MFALRNWQILSWVGHNIFGNRDGLVLDDPGQQGVEDPHQGSGRSPQIVGYKPQTHVSIEYIESLDDWKTAWDHIHFQGFLGTKMMMQFIWQGCDSILAAPLVLDLARLALLSQRRGEVGVLQPSGLLLQKPDGRRTSTISSSSSPCWKAMRQISPHENAGEPSDWKTVSLNLNSSSCHRSPRSLR